MSLHDPPSVMAVIRPTLALFGTLGGYEAGLRLQRLCRGHPSVNPVLIAVTLVGAGIYWLGMPASDYNAAVQPLILLLGPATVALALPLYRCMPRIRVAIIPIFITVLSGALIAPVTAVGLAIVLGAPSFVLHDWRGLSVFLFGGVLGLPLGLWLLLHTEHHLYTRVLGAFLLFYGGYMLARTPGVLSLQHRGFDLIAGVLGGISGTAAAFPNGLVAIWCSFKGWNKDRQRAMFQPFILVMQVVSLGAISAVTYTLVITGNRFALGDLLCVPAGLLGIFMGLALYRRIPHTSSQLRSTCC